ncbi:putative ATP-dependent RNA helicase DDX10 [Lycorma delicatula]|uniref:putative ATP-dependent RNA helicase DDX10 n=1 Tax=Lycorma delicatula TaxID=130591 RepID=UPI003F5147A6
MPVANELQNNMEDQGEKNKRNKKGKKAKIKLFNKKKTINTDEVISKLQCGYATINPKEVNKFSDLPLSFKTQKGLRENGFTDPTEIQKESIGYALQGCDILGAAKTGSGKTLAFVIPVLEKLFCTKWTRLDGTGALIITPTRELAYQIFETLRKVGFYHDFSAGLIIGGKDLKFEKKRMDQCNIVICTPGRLLHHMDENPLFDCVNLQILVLDEADRCLDLGFEQTMNNIIENLPPNRQTLLFSATQTKSVRDLARLSLTSPKYISVHEHSSYSTPEGLTQSYTVCELEDKITLLWSFIRNHYKHKILVFLSSCKQVKYVFEIFCQLRPGIALLALYGSLHQQRRMDIYKSFCNKEHAVLFATDIAARGLDFPAVNWVIQVDCPEDATTYIHRVGRTARYHKGGEALLILLPSEEKAMLANLNKKRIPINEMKVNPKMLQNPKVKIEAMLARKPELKESAQRAFVAYIKSVFLMKDKKVFDVHKLNTDSFARSLGLVVSPRIRFLQRLQKNQIKKEKDNVQTSFTFKNSVSGDDGKMAEIKVENIVKSESENSDVSEDDENNARIKTKTEKRSCKNNGSYNKTNFKIENDMKSEPLDSENNDSEDDSSLEPDSQLNSGNKIQSKRFETFNFGIDDSDSDEEILKVKRTNHNLDNEEEGNMIPLDESSKTKKKPLTKAAIAKRILKKNIVANKRLVFTEEGEAIENKFKQKVTELGKKYEEECEGGGISIEEAKKVLREEDKIDKQLFKERIKMKHKEERLKLKKLRKGSDSDEDESDHLSEEFEQNDDNDNEDESGSETGSSESSQLRVHSDEDEDTGASEEGENDSDDDDSILSKNDTVSRNSSRKGKKRKPDNIKNNNKRLKSDRSSLLQDEELALKLLTKRS